LPVFPHQPVIGLQSWSACCRADRALRTGRPPSLAAIRDDSHPRRSSPLPIRPSSCCGSQSGWTYRSRLYGRCASWCSLGLRPSCALRACDRAGAGPARSARGRRAGIGVASPCVDLSLLPITGSVSRIGTPVFAMPAVSTMIGRCADHLACWVALGAYASKRLARAGDTLLHRFIPVIVMLAAVLFVGSCQPSSPGGAGPNPELFLAISLRTVILPSWRQALPELSPIVGALMPGCDRRNRISRRSRLPPAARCAGCAWRVLSCSHRHDLDLGVIVARWRVCSLLAAAGRCDPRQGGV